MYLRRKIDDQLYRWLNTRGHSPALVVGVRQCGKTESIRHFATQYFENLVYVNFWTTPLASDSFNGELDIDEITKRLSLVNPDYVFVPGKTLVFLDEIQDCPRARLSLKNFKEDGRYEVIASGSHIGINLDSDIGSSEPKPNGAEDIIRMYTMDFQEFLWANSYRDEQIQELKKYYDERSDIPDDVHMKMKSLFKEYMCIGGYPETVSLFIENKNFGICFRKNESLIFDIKGDPSKRKTAEGKPMYTSYEVARIQNAFDLVGSFAISDNSRFVLSRISGGNGLQKKDALNYLINSCTVFKANNVTVPSLPLNLNKIEADFKLFYCDIGLLATLCGFDTIRGIQNESLGISKGFLYESVIAETFYKNEIPVFYFGKNSGLEIDLVISYNGYPTLVEIKATNGNTKSSKTVMSHPEHYGQTKLIKIGDYSSVTENDDMLTVPHYLSFLLRDEDF